MEFDAIEAFRQLRDKVKGFAKTGADGIDYACDLLDEVKAAGRKLAEQMRQASAMSAESRAECEQLHAEFGAICFDGATATDGGASPQARAETAHGGTAGFTRDVPADVKEIDWRAVLANLARVILGEFLKR